MSSTEAPTPMTPRDIFIALQQINSLTRPLNSAVRFVLLVMAIIMRRDLYFSPFPFLYSFIDLLAQTFENGSRRDKHNEYADPDDGAEEPVLVGAGEGRRRVVAELDRVAIVVREANI